MSLLFGAISPPLARYRGVAQGQEYFKIPQWGEIQNVPHMCGQHIKEPVGVRGYSTLTICLELNFDTATVCEQKLARSVAVHANPAVALINRVFLTPPRPFTPAAFDLRQIVISTSSARKGFHLLIDPRSVRAVR